MLKQFFIIIATTIILCFTCCKTQMSGIGNTGSGNPNTSTVDSTSVQLNYLTEDYAILESVKEIDSKLVAKSVPNKSVAHYISENKLSNKIDTTSTQSIVPGSMSYFIPKEMSVRNTYKIYLKISKSKILLQEYQNDTLIKVATIPVTQTMEVKLIDPTPEDNKAFSIITENTSMQFMDDIDSCYTEWNWSVTPLQSGNNKLSIVISIIKDGVRKEKVYEDVVNVKVNLKNQTFYFFKKNWQILLTSLIIPFIIFLWKRYKKNKE